MYYEKPNEFYPEHFTEEARRKRPKCSYMPFGEGPRICIGEKFNHFGYFGSFEGLEYP